MKKLVFGLIATVMLSSLTCNSQTTVNEYFKKPIFELLKSTNLVLYNELVNSKFQKVRTNGKDVVYINLKNGYFVDDSEKMIYSEISKSNKTITINDFTSNFKTTFALEVNEDGFFSNLTKDSSVKSIDLFDPKSVPSNVVFRRGCRDNAGFALCYGLAVVASIAIASSDGPLPLMDGLAITYLVGQTAYCLRSHC